VNHVLNPALNLTAADALAPTFMRALVRALVRVTKKIHPVDKIKEILSFRLRPTVSTKASVLYSQLSV
jgi:hypothetical protein